MKNLSAIELAAYRHAKKLPGSRQYGRRFLYQTPAGMLMVEFSHKQKDWRGVWLTQAVTMHEYTDGRFRCES